MDKMRMESVDLTAQNIEKIGALFPNCVTEMLDEEKSTPDQKVYKKAINFDMLKQMLSGDVLEGDEAYEFTWVGKKASIVEANKPIRKTLRPCKEESVNWDTTENLYIEGDNLEVLKLLQESYLGKVKMIYIDPPYNTGNDILYKNNYSISKDEYNEEIELDDNGNIMFINTETNGRFHSDWCSMIYERLLLSRNLLKNDGVIVIAIDHYELSQLISICDEVFSEKNRLGIVTVVHKPEGRNQEKFISTSNEFCLFYAKDKSRCEFNDVVLDTELKNTYNHKDDIGYFKIKNYVRLGGGDQNLRVNKEHFWYPIYVNRDLTKCSLTNEEGWYEVYPISPTGQERTWKTKKETTEIAIKNGDLIGGKDSNGNVIVCEKYRKGQLIKTHWIDKRYNAINGGTKVLEEIMSCKTFDFPKSIYLIEDIIKLTTSNKDLILDYFSGSATTAHAILNVNSQDDRKRKFIMVQIPQTINEKEDAYRYGYSNICEIGKERIRRAGKKILEENKDKEGIENLDIGFRVLKLDDTNMTDVYYSPEDYSQDLLSMLESNVKSDRNDLDLLFGCLLEWGLSLSLPYSSEQIDGCTVHNYNDGDLIACFDENVPDSVIKEIAQRQPLRAVFRDSSFANSPSKINVGEIFKLIAPNTKVKVI